MNKYEYNGPVMEFDKCVEHKWSSSTYAISEDKARNNLAYQYKKKHNKNANSKISLPGKITIVV